MRQHDHSIENVIFSEAFVEGFLKWNDQQKRDNHEAGVGGKMQ